MRKLLSVTKEHNSIFAVWLGIAAAILFTLLVMAAASRTASANTLDRPGLGIVHCNGDGVNMDWITENEGQASAPDGWKIE